MVNNLSEIDDVTIACVHNRKKHDERTNTSSTWLITQTLKNLVTEVSNLDSEISEIRTLWTLRIR